MEDITLETLAETGNIAETIARELKAPVVLATDVPHVSRVALPPGWTLDEHDDEQRQLTPRRKKAKIRLETADSFIDYVKRHGSLSYSTIWCQADYPAGKVELQAIINDNGEEEDPHWRDHVARYTPVFSQEWRTWVEQHKKSMSQADFATFIEDNRADIASGDGLPTGAQMLEMALNFEANQDMRFKSALRLQNGGVQMSFVQDDDQQTLANMQLFERFAIGIPVFWGGDAYHIDARLRYRVREGKLTFWYELIRREKILEDAAKTVVAKIRTETGNPFFFGNPFAN